MRIQMIGALILGVAAVPAGAQAQVASDIAEGARVYGQQCTRCHSARSSAERTDRQWLTIVSHMRARANLTKSQARQVAAYLAATNAPETVVQAQAATGSGEPVTTTATVQAGRTLPPPEQRRPRY